MRFQTRSWKGGSTPPPSCNLSSDSNSRPIWKSRLISHLAMPPIDMQITAYTLSYGLIKFSKTTLPQAWQFSGARLNLNPNFQIPREVIHCCLIPCCRLTNTDIITISRNGRVSPLRPRFTQIPSHPCQ
jgi:hypothetical protein